MSSRREKIEAMLLLEPDDCFLRYALAMELDKEGANERSLSLLAGLQQMTPPYVPAFLMGAQQLMRLDRTEEAIAVLRKGIDAAQSQTNTHAASEMQGLLDMLT